MALPPAMTVMARRTATFWGRHGWTRRAPNFTATVHSTCSSCHDLNTKCVPVISGRREVKGQPVPPGRTGLRRTTSWPHQRQCATRAIRLSAVTAMGRPHATTAPWHYCPACCPIHRTRQQRKNEFDLLPAVPCTAGRWGPGSNPRFNVAIGSLSTGCESSGCHKANTAHPVNWSGPDSTSHQSAQNMAAACALCHGAELSGGSGPACRLCHTAGSPLTQNNCTSCHTKPPAGTTHPDRSGAHAICAVFTGVTDTCGICHAGAGSQTALHYNDVVNIAFTGYNAKSGAPAYAAADQTCANVSCHGGKKTPVWGTGTINVTTECNACRASSGQYNSYVSGEHEKACAGRENCLQRMS